MDPGIPAQAKTVEKERGNEGKRGESERVRHFETEKFHPQGLKIPSGMEVALLNTSLTLMTWFVLLTLFTLNAKTLAYMPIYCWGRSEQYWNGLWQFEQNVG